MGLEFFDKAREVMQKLESTQKENIHKAALLISESIRNGGILQEAVILTRALLKCAVGRAA